MQALVRGRTICRARSVAAVVGARRGDGAPLAVAASARRLRGCRLLAPQLCTALLQSRARAFASAVPPPPAAAAPQGGSGSGGAAASSGSRLRRAVVIIVRGLGLWFPALLFWVSLVSGTSLLDLRTDEEIQEDENEVRRLERFFDVEGLSEFDYMAEWAAKEEALASIIDKLLRSPHFADALIQGLDGLLNNSDQDGQAATSSRSRRSAKMSDAEADELGASVEVSYVLPPPAIEEGGTLGTALHAGAARPWTPRLVIAHESGSLAVVWLTLEHIDRAKDREERWTCTVEDESPGSQRWRLLSQVTPERACGLSPRRASR